MRPRFFILSLLSAAFAFAQPADCDDRELFATLQVLHQDCDSLVLQAYRTPGVGLRWFVNDVEATGETDSIFRLTGSTDGFAVGVVAEDGNFCRYTEYNVLIEGGCPVEDCANGIDDDGNGLVDLNDTDACDCGEAPERRDPNLFPNPGFEQRRDLPECRGCYTPGERLPCVADWRPGNNITTIEHVLRCFAGNNPSRFTNYVSDGANFSIIGGFAAYDRLDFTILESALVPLNEATIPGERYRLTFLADIAGGDIFDLRDEVSGPVFQYLSWYASPALTGFPYRFSSLDDFSTSVLWQTWSLLDSVAIEINDNFNFEQFAIEFTAPPTPIRAMVFAGARSQPGRRIFTDIRGDYELYWVLDNVSLQRILPPLVAIEDIDATVTARPFVRGGSNEPCAAGLLLTAPDEPGNVYQWYREGVAISGATESTYLIPPQSLDGSRYRVRITRQGSCVISQPEPARRAEPFELDFQVDSLRCGADADGRILARVSPQNAEYRLLWQNAAGDRLGTSDELPNLRAGDYFLTVTDALGCTYEYEFNLEAPPPLEATLSAEDLDCNSPDGQAPLPLNLTGGVPPYDYFYGEETTPAPRPLRRPPGTYRLRIVDDIGCEFLTEPVAIDDPAPFSLELTGLRTTLKLGEATALRLQSNRLLDDALVDWLPARWVSCVQCPTTVVRPTESGMLRVVVTDTDGCIREDSLGFTIIPDRPIYFPNAVSPNGDGVNDAFRPYPGPSVAEIRGLEIFDRWGNLQYSDKSLNPIWAPKPTIRAGVYVYLVTVRFTDGKVQNYTGALTLVR